jgi:hypothetical protein
MPSVDNRAAAGTFALCNDANWMQLLVDVQDSRQTFVDAR